MLLEDKLGKIRKLFRQNQRKKHLYRPWIIEEKVYHGYSKKEIRDTEKTMKTVFFSQ